MQRRFPQPLFWKSQTYPACHHERHLHGLSGQRTRPMVGRCGHWIRRIFLCAGHVKPLINQKRHVWTHRMAKREWHSSFAYPCFKLRRGAVRTDVSLHWLLWILELLYEYWRYPNPKSLIPRSKKIPENMVIGRQRLAKAPWNRLVVGRLGNKHRQRRFNKPMVLFGS